MFNFSWGPDDNGKTVDGPHRLAQVNSCQITFVFKLAMNWTFVKENSVFLRFLKKFLQKTRSYFFLQFR